MTGYNLRPVSLGLRSNKAVAGVGGSARLVNLYAENVGDEGTAPWNLIGCSGFDLFATLPDSGAVRSMMALTDAELYVVAGRLCFRVDSTGSATVLGGIPSDGLCTMARNRKSTPEIAVVSDGLVFKIVGGTLTQVSDPDLPPATSVTEVNGYFVFQMADGRMFSSELDEFNVLATDFAASNSSPDNAVRVYSRGQDLISFGAKSVEFWQDQGGDTFPFGRITSRSIGLLAAGAVAEVDQTVGFVAHDRTVRMLSGYDAARVSTHALERQIEKDENKPGITCTAWQENGHTFMAVSGTGWTWVYDASTQLWHERESYSLGRWRVSGAVRFGGRTMLGDYATGKIYRMSGEIYTEDGAHLVSSVTMPPITADGNKFNLDRIELDMETGVGLVSSEDHLADPQVMLDYTRDGQNFSSQRFMSAGRAGQSMTKVYANRLGRHDVVSLRFSISAPVRRRLIRARVGIS